MENHDIPVTTEKDDMKKHNAHPARRRAGVLLPALALFVAAGCDTDITNPGPVPDAFLDDITAHKAVVTGARRNLADALDRAAYWVGAFTYEINPSGSTGSFGIPSSVQDGRYDRNFSGDWNRTSLARWAAEDALRRFAEVLPDIPGAPAFNAYDLAAEATLYAGYANRLMGEAFCQVVFDGGGIQASTDALVRAEGHFTTAESIATAAGKTAFATAAIAGRASVRADLATYGLASWTDAANDASGIASSFTFVMPYSDQDQSQGNYIMVAAPGLGTYRAATVWGTFYEDYFRLNPLDTRTPWVVGDQPFGDAGVTKFGGNVTFLPQDKYDEPEDPINLSSGWEMRLIEAEAQLDAGNAAAAVTLMNLRRTDLGLPLLTSATVAAAYTDLKLERALELWLEGRRMFDLRRWGDNNVSGGISDVLDGIYGTGTAGCATCTAGGGTTTIGNGTAVGVLDTQMTTLAANVKCWPIGDSEFDTNTGVSR